MYVVWQDDTPGNFDIFFARSTDGGLTFSEPPENLSENTGSSTEPQISVEGNNVYVVWEDDTPGINDIFFARSTDGGLTFSEPPQNISESTGVSFNPHISSDGDNVYVVWQDNTPGGGADIFFSRSTDGGLTFSEPPENLSENTGFSSQPQISVEGNNVYVVWVDSSPGNSDIFFVRSTDGGLTFSEPPENISESTGNSLRPQISSDGDNVYVVWQSVNEDIFFSRSTDGGLTFSEPPQNLSENTGSSFSPEISSDGDNVYVVWYDDTTPDDDFDIFFATSTDGGLTFSELPDNNISENPGGSFLPQISSTTS